MSVHLLFRYLEFVVPSAAQFVVLICDKYQLHSFSCAISVKLTIQKMQHALINHAFADFKEHLLQFNYWIAELIEVISERNKSEDRLVLKLLALLNGHIATQVAIVEKVFPLARPAIGVSDVDVQNQVQLHAAINPASVFGGHFEPAFLSSVDEVRTYFMRIGEELDTIIAYAVEDMAPIHVTAALQLEYLDIERTYILRDKYLLLASNPNPNLDMMYKTFQEIITLLSTIGRNKDLKYYNQFHPYYVNERVPGHYDCVFCKVGIVHCFYGSLCSNLAECIAHRLLDKKLFADNLNSVNMVKFRLMLHSLSEEELYDALTEPTNREYVEPDVFSAGLRLGFAKTGLGIFRPVIGHIPDSDEFQPVAFLSTPDLPLIHQVKQKIQRLISIQKLDNYPEAFIEFLSLLMSGHLSIAARYVSSRSLIQNCTKYMYQPPNQSIFVNALIDTVFFAYRQGHSVDLRSTIARIQPAVENMMDLFPDPKDRGVSELSQRVNVISLSDSESDEETDDPSNELFRRLRDAAVMD